MIFGLKSEDDRSEALRKFKIEESEATSAAETKEARSKFEKAMEASLQKEMAQINEVLLPSQVERLQQIRIQILQNQSGGLNLLIDELDFSNRQKNQFQKFQEDSRQQAVAIVTQIRNKEITQSEGRKAIKAIGDEVKVEFLELLSASQKEELRELEGDPFEFQTNEIDDEAAEETDKEDDR